VSAVQLVTDDAVHEPSDSCSMALRRPPLTSDEQGQELWVHSTRCLLDVALRSLYEDAYVSGNMALCNHNTQIAALWQTARRLN
jgi:hypothetical protein